MQPTYIGLNSSVKIKVCERLYVSLQSYFTHFLSQENTIEQNRKKIQTRTVCLCHHILDRTDAQSLDLW